MNASKQLAWTALAVDLGASTGRVLAGKFDGERLALSEIHRFENEPVQLRETLHWDFPRLFHEVQLGTRKAIRQASDTGESISSLGIDTWGVDFGLLDRKGRLLGNPVHYRDRRTEGIMEKVFATIPREEIFRTTGVQFLPFNTIYQLAAMKHSQDPQLEQAGSLLMMPDLIFYFLTGRKVAEFTDATTTQLFDPRKGNWSAELIERLGLPRHLFQPIIQPGAETACLLPSVAEALGGDQLSVAAGATHDTASAVAAVPSTRERFAYLSCGTWSLLGTEVTQPVLTDQALALNFTNEGGVAGTYRLLKNIMGLWLLQETKRIWENRGNAWSWPELTRLAAEGEAFAAFVDPDDPAFLPPGDMAARLQRYCRESGQPVPQTEAGLLRCMVESLALKYRWGLDRLDELTGCRAEVLHMVGGGIQNTLLCQMTANAIGRPVLAGPIEATALGNLSVQLLAAGQIASISQAREIILRSFPLREYQPQDGAAWQEAYERFCAITERATAPRRET